MYYETFCEKLKKERSDAGYTQREAAKILNIKQPTYAGYESGRTQPDIEMLGRIADLYCVSTDWLIGTKGGKGD